MKVATVVGTRPELIKLSQIIKEVEKHAEHVFIHTGQNYDYELNQVFFENLQLRRPDYFLECNHQDLFENIGSIIEKTGKLLRDISPDAVIFYGDTNSCLGAIAAKRLKIPIFHLEAGNRCMDIRVPEEINRRLIDHLSDINFVHSEHARRYLLEEGLSADKIIKTGTPLFEVIQKNLKNIECSNILERLELETGKFFVVSSHREENVDSRERLESLLAGLKVLKEKFLHPIIFSTHPRTKKRLMEFGLEQQTEGIVFLKPLGFFDYLKLQKESFCVLSDSGTLTEEADILAFPAVMLRDTHERPEGMDRATCLMSGILPERMVKAVELATKSRSGPAIEDYRFEHVSEQVIRVIFSYIPYIRQTVWREY